MSSLLLSLSSKLSLRKLALRCHTLGMFSSSSTNPYLMYCPTYCGGETPEAGVMTEFLVFDPATEEYFSVGDKPLPKAFVNSKLVGSSHGWGVFLSYGNSMTISDYSNPSSSKSNPKMIHLGLQPSFLGSCQTKLVSGFAMSSSSPEDEEDLVMAVKYKGRLVRMFTLVKGDILPSPTYIVDYFEQANLMYSKRDQRFYMPSSGGHHLWSCSCKTDPQYHDLRFHNLPQFSFSELQLLNSCYRKQQLVESPSGQRFLVKWYVQDLSKYVISVFYRRVNFNSGGTKRFMVFREEENMNMCYTEDIGDLCIFLGNNEPFCVKASSFPGLNPNSIYFLGEGFGEGYGVYDIATRTPRSFNPKSFPACPDLPNAPCHVLPNWVPHWVPPFPL